MQWLSAVVECYTWDRKVAGSRPTGGIIEGKPWIQSFSVSKNDPPSKDDD